MLQFHDFGRIRQPRVAAATFNGNKHERDPGTGGRNRTGEAMGGIGRGIDWGAQVRLALVMSVFAALSAIALAGHVGESVIVVGVIVRATMASWYQMERPGLEHALTRTHRR